MVGVALVNESCSVERTCINSHSLKELRKLRIIEKREPRFWFGSPFDHWVQTFFRCWTRGGLHLKSRRARCNSLVVLAPSTHRPSATDSFISSIVDSQLLACHMLIEQFQKSIPGGFWSNPNTNVIQALHSTTLIRWDWPSLKCKEMIRLYRFFWEDLREVRKKKHTMMIIDSFRNHLIASLSCVSDVHFVKWKNLIITRENFYVFGDSGELIREKSRKVIEKRWERTSPPKILYEKWKGDWQEIKQDQPGLDFER